MSNYFRVTAYHESENVSAIIDSNGYYKQLWELSSFLLKKGFRILEVSDDSKFLDGNIPKADKNTECLILRACCSGKPEYNGNTVCVQGRYYTPEK